MRYVVISSGSTIHSSKGGPTPCGMRSAEDGASALRSFLLSSSLLTTSPSAPATSGRSVLARYPGRIAASNLSPGGGGGYRRPAAADRRRASEARLTAP